MNDVALITETMHQLTAKGIESAEVAMLSMEQAPCPVNHYFGPGIYIREVSMSAGLFAIGHRQTQEHVNIMLKGRVLMLQEDGSTTELAAPLMFTGKPGRKMGYILEDVVWQNIYATDERDVQVLESMFLDTVQEQSENIADQCPMPQGSWKVKTGQSPIQGTGIFLTADAEEDEVLGPARIMGLRTPLGRYTNHSPNPNACMVLRYNGDIDLVTLRAVKGCAGGSDGDEVTIDYRQALSLSGVVCSTIGELT
jgi:hypothetical protein